MKILAGAYGLNKLVFREMQARLWIGCQIPREHRGEPLHIRERQGKFKTSSQVACGSGMTAKTLTHTIDQVATASHLVHFRWWQAGYIEPLGR